MEYQCKRGEKRTKMRTKVMLELHRYSNNVACKELFESLRHQVIVFLRIIPYKIPINTIA